MKGNSKNNNIAKKAPNKQTTKKQGGQKNNKGSSGGKWVIVSLSTTALLLVVAVALIKASELGYIPSSFYYASKFIYCCVGAWGAGTLFMAFGMDSKAQQKQQQVDDDLEEDEEEEEYRQPISKPNRNQKKSQPRQGNTTSRRREVIEEEEEEDEEEEVRRPAPRKKPQPQQQQRKVVQRKVVKQEEQEDIDEDDVLQDILMADAPLFDDDDLYEDTSALHLLDLTKKEEEDKAKEEAVKKDEETADKPTYIEITPPPIRDGEFQQSNVPKEEPKVVEEREIKPVVEVKQEPVVVAKPEPAEVKPNREPVHEVSSIKNVADEFLTALSISKPIIDYTIVEEGQAGLIIEEGTTLLKCTSVMLNKKVYTASSGCRSFRVRRGDKVICSYGFKFTDINRVVELEPLSRIQEVSSECIIPTPEDIANNKSLLCIIIKARNDRDISFDDLSISMFIHP